MNLPRPEHPNPQFERERWLCLNGAWEFQKDPGKSGKARGLFAPDAVFSEKITMPFCPQSRLSGVGDTDFLPCVWYRRSISVTPEQLSGLVMLHIGACDYRTTVYVNAVCAGTHSLRI